MGLIQFEQALRLKPQGRVSVNDKWRGLGLKSLYLLDRNNWRINQVTGQVGGAGIGSGPAFGAFGHGGDWLFTYSSSTNYVTLEHGLSLNVALPITIVAGWRLVSGNVSWSLLRTDQTEWSGWYGGGTGTFSTAQNNVFDGGLSTGGTNNVAFCHAGANNLYGASGAGSAIDTAVTAPTGVQADAISLGLSRRAKVDNPTTAVFTHFAVFQAALPMWQLVELANNPWQLFAPKRIWVPVSAGGGIQTLTGDSTVQTATSELDTVTSIHIVVAAPANQAANSSTDVIQQVHFVSSAASSQSNNANVGAITLAQTLAGDSCTQNVSCTTGSIGQVHIVTATSTIQDANSGTGIYTSTQLLYADPTTQTTTSTSDSIVHIHILLASNSIQAANDSVFAITQDHELVSSTDNTQYNNSSTDAAEIGLYVLADNSNQTATSSANVITLIQLLVAADSISTAISTESGITQVHILLATPSYGDNYSDSNVIVNIHNLTVATDIQLNQSTAEALLANAYREGYYISSEVKSVVIVSKNGDTFVISNPNHGIVTTTNK